MRLETCIYFLFNAICDSFYILIGNDTPVEINFLQDIRCITNRKSLTR